MTAQEPQEAIWLPHPPQGHKVPSPCQGQRLRAVVIQRSPADLHSRDKQTRSEEGISLGDQPPYEPF